MNLYQKIATFVLRLISTLVFLYGAVYLIIFVLNGFTSNNPDYFTSRFPAQEKILLLTGLFFAILGGIGFSLSNLIGKIVGKGLDD
jgi:ABC-type transport system involved in multi-copper enzyme maturation permease subunit